MESCLGLHKEYPMFAGRTSICFDLRNKSHLLHRWPLLYYYYYYYNYTLGMYLENKDTARHLLLIAA